MEYLADDAKGQYIKKNKYTKTTPRKWTDAEVEWLKKLSNEGYSRKQIAKSMDRSLISINVKLKRLKKKDNSYNLQHLSEK